MSRVLVALTYDDGPSPWTDPILSTLAIMHSRATFFVLGTNIKGYEDLLRMMVEDGHEIGVHGWTHDRVKDLSHGTLRSHLRQTAGAIHDATGVYPTLWRPPWHLTTPGAVQAAEEVGLKLCGVTVDTLDGIASEGDIVARALAGLERGAILGLHDGIAPNGNREAKSRTATVRATARILEKCRSVTVSELLA